jgi:hypothetical protein
VKPIHLNLASRPYRDYRPLYAVVVAGSLLIAWMLLNNIETYYRYVNETQATRAEIDKLDAETAKEKQRADDAKNRIRGINLTALDLQTKFINSEIAERAFSWSELLDRLETVLAPNARILTIAPSFDKTGLVHLELSCEAKTSEGMTEMMTRFNLDPHFAKPFPHQETATPNGYSFTVGVDYIPSQMATSGAKKRPATVSLLDADAKLPAPPAETKDALQ